MFASEEELEQESDAYDCETCQVLQAVEELSPENADAWRMFHRVATRIGADLHMADLILNRLTSDLDAEAFGDLADRLGIIYDAIYPPATRTDEGK
jgi:hypothetical protein